MKKKRLNESKSGFFISILIRYAILIILALPNFWLFYFVFTPLTVYFVYFLLNLFFNASLVGNTKIIFNSIPIEIIGACVAGSAYYLLSILNLSTPNINLQKRVKMILFSFFFFLIINVLRIFLLSLLLVSGSSFFDITHKLFWYIGSTLFVIGIWFAEVKYFKIKDIPFYSDVKLLYKNAGRGK